jgi:hypothetical protein
VDKDRIYERVRYRVERQCGENTPKACLFWAAHAMEALQAEGLRAIVQAGTCLWPRVRPEDFDGLPPAEPTHFGYEWQPDDPATLARIKAGLLPEIHVWVAVPDRAAPGGGVIVDFTTGYFPGNCPFPWLGPMPPRYFWGGPGDLPDLTFYRAEPSAIAAVLRFAAGIASGVA